MNDLSIIIISGLSGAGKSNAAKVLEDLGYNTIDNMPLQIIERIIELFATMDKSGSKVAFVIDSRSKDSNLAYDTIKMLKDKHSATLLFMDATVETLVKRYKETRRKHPQGDDLVEAIKTEVSLMSDIKCIADFVFSSDGKSVHQLAKEITSYFEEYATSDLNITLQSFGFKHGIPSEADMVFDVRFFKNPYFVEELKSLTGLFKDVQDYVKSDENYAEFVAKVSDLLIMLLPQYIKEGKKYLNIAIGCTGGHHRSVTVVEDIAGIFKSQTTNIIRIKHRDIDR